MKLLHMDALAACITIPPDAKQLWTKIHMARTLGEDVPQGLLQIMYLVYVKNNKLMIISVLLSFGLSIKAWHDASTRQRAAAGGNVQLLVNVGHGNGDWTVKHQYTSVGLGKGNYTANYGKMVRCEEGAGYMTRTATPTWVGLGNGDCNVQTFGVAPVQ